MLDFAGLGVPCATQLRFSPGDGFAQALLLSGQRLGATAEQLPLQVQRSRRLWIIEQFRAEGDCGQTFTFRTQPCLAGEGREVLAAQGLHLPTQRGFLQAQQHLTCADHITVAHIDTFDDATGRVLHRFAMP